MSENHAGHMPSSGRALTISAWLTGVYFIVELGIGLWTGSVAVISDAFHTFSAVGGVLVAIIAARIAKRPADEQKSFGWLRAEIIGALVNGAFLLIMALVVIVMGLMRLGNPIDLPTGPMLIAAAGGLVTEFISLYLLYRQQGSDLNVRGAYWHIIQTFVGSLIIIVAALVIRFTGFLAIDPVLGIIFGFLLLWASWGILRDAIHLLMEGTPDEISLAEAKAALATIPGVKNVHHVHVWALTSGKYVFSAHVMVDKRAEIDSDEVLTIAQGKLVDEFGFFFTTIQVETRCHDEERARTIDALVDRSMAT
ncbi:cation diffusion facilitator family transporter [Oricola indica]|uniref:cation diffusion facilitator family transporter n=1 Tax=Oricola indica TaxID=2872591 RepID=UPI003CCC3556